MSNEIKLSYNQSKGYEDVEINTISSREVATMMEMTHDNFLKKVSKHTVNFNSCTDVKINVSGYWFESTYKDSTGRECKEYQVTKRGCEFLAHKTTGVKGDLFTIRYMERFEQMENHIKQQVPQTYAQALLEAGRLALELEQKQKQIEVMEPKAIAYDKFMEADGTYTTTNACKMLGLKRNKVFEVLRDKGLVYKNKTEATQKAIDRGLFKQVLKNGYPTMVITPKGIDYIKDLTI